MGILSGQGNILNDGDNCVSLIDSIMNFIQLINDCSSIKEHNKACKLLVNILGKQTLDLNNESLFNINSYGVNDLYKSGRLKSPIKSVLVYSPPRGCRSAIIHIFNAINDIDNVKIAESGFCCALGDYWFDVYDGTVAFDITNEKLVTYVLNEHLKIFQWC